jgi:predicted pPIWI-associating nuclease
VVRRLTPAQARSRLRQAQQRQRQALNKYKGAVRKLNNAVDNYNRKARSHNAKVRANQQRLQREIRRLNSAAPARHVAYRRSVVTLTESFSRIEATVDAGTWAGGDEILDMAEGEAANSVAVFNALQHEAESDPEADNDSLRVTSLAGELLELSPDLNARWGGALYALSPQNPDAARHFCTSSREILTSILDISASDKDVLKAEPGAERTQDGRVTRRARVRHCLRRRGTYDPELEAFVEDDIDNVLALFYEFNQATHGSAGRFDLKQLEAIKGRVEDAIRFLHRITR